MNAYRRVLRHSVPADDQAHTLRLSGPIVHVATRSADVVEFWTDSLVDEQWEPVHAQSRTFRVFGTGHDVPLGGGWEFVGTAFALGGPLVWHLFEATP